MTPLVAVVGSSKAGKTTLLEKLIPVLKARGWRVAVIKHDVHGFEIDHEGKDTWRLRRAGADVVCIASSRQVAFMQSVPSDPGLKRLVARMPMAEVDLILAEGYKGEEVPKVEVWRPELSPEPLCKDDPWLLALVASEETGLQVPRFSPQEPEALARFLEEKFLAEPEASRVRLAVDGQPVALGTFARTALVRTVLGFISSLKGCKDPREVDLTIREPSRGSPDPGRRSASD
jgi:molybdopterin-guanine dinucleotide biosynthesis protein B